jgi:hypothetical protein
MWPPTHPSSCALSLTRLPLQSAMAFCLWHEGDLYDDWSAASLAMSDDAKLQAIMDGIHEAYNVGLEDVCQVHVFFKSSNTLHLTMNTSHYSGQQLSLSICKVLVPWLQHHPNNTVHFHHMPTLQDAEQSHRCLMAGTLCSGPRSTLAQTS